jgi:hypothetical protein
MISLHCSIRKTTIKKVQNLLDIAMGQKAKFAIYPFLFANIGYAVDFVSVAKLR